MPLTDYPRTDDSCTAYVAAPDPRAAGPRRLGRPAARRAAGQDHTSTTGSASISVLRRASDPLEQPVDIAMRGPLAEAAELAYRAIVAALVEQPRSVLCDLSRTTGAAVPEALAVLALTGVETCSWLGVPVALVCPDSALRYALTALPESRFLIVASRRATALARLRSLPATDRVTAVLPVTARTASEARRLVARTLLDWGCGAQIGAATLAAQELVTGAVLGGDGDRAVEVSVARCGDLLRLAARALPLELEPAVEARADPRTPVRPAGRGMLVVAALARSWGVLPASDGGRVLWAVLDADPASRFAAWAGSRAT